MYLNKALNGTSNIEAQMLAPNVLAVPCGMLPKFFPTDTFTSVTSKDGSQNYAITTQNISFRQARYNFSNYRNFNETNGVSVRLSNWTDLTQDRFSIWLKMNSYFGAFKLWGVLATNLTAGSYFLNLFNSYDVSLLQGAKYMSVNAGSSMFVTPNKLLVGNLGTLGVISLIGSIWLTVLACQVKKKEL